MWPCFQLPAGRAFRQSPCLHAVSVYGTDLVRLRRTPPEPAGVVVLEPAGPTVDMRPRVARYVRLRVIHDLSFIASVPGIHAGNKMNKSSDIDSRFLHPNTLDLD